MTNYRVTMQLKLQYIWLEVDKAQKYWPVHSSEMHTNYCMAIDWWHLVSLCDEFWFSLWAHSLSVTLPLELRGTIVL